MQKKKKPKKAKKKSAKKQTKKTKTKKPKFEDCIEAIDQEIARRRSKWGLTALAWMDFEDVSQIIRLHIFRKWHLYNPEKNLLPWVRTIISNQIKNLIRNNYTNFVKPCVKCAAAQGGEGCTIYGSQDSSCPLYKNWERNKKSAYDTKMPVPLETYSQEVQTMTGRKLVDIEKAAEKVHEKMKQNLKRNEWMIYKYLYIDFKSELEVAKLMGYKTSEKNRSPGYKQIKNVKKKIIVKVKEIVRGDELDIF
jgi:DNA-directed RNA polymerase specialized sigma24 family protein